MFFVLSTQVQTIQNTIYKTEPIGQNFQIVNYIMQSSLYLINCIILLVSIFGIALFLIEKKILSQESKLTKILVIIFLLFTSSYSVSSICISSLSLAKIINYSYLINIIYVAIDLFAIMFYLICNYQLETSILKYSSLGVVILLVILFSCLREIAFLIFFIFFDKFDYYCESIDENNEILLKDNNTKITKNETDLQQQTNSLVQDGYKAIDNIMYDQASNLSLALNSNNFLYNNNSNNDPYTLGNFIRAYLINIYDQLAIQVFGSQLNKISRAIKGGSSTDVKTILQQIINQYIKTGNNNMIKSLVDSINGNGNLPNAIDQYYVQEISTQGTNINNTLSQNILNVTTKYIETQIDITINKIINTAISNQGGNIGIIINALQTNSDLKTSVTNRIKNALSPNNSILVSNISNYIIQQGFANLYQNNKQITIDEAFKQTIDSAINVPNANMTDIIETYLYNNVPSSSILNIIANYIKPGYTDINLAIQMYCADLLQSNSSSNLQINNQSFSHNDLVSKSKSIFQNAVEYSISNYLVPNDKTFDVAVQDYFLNRIINFNSTIFTTLPTSLTIYDVISEYLQISILNEALTGYSAANASVQGNTQTNEEQDLVNNYNYILQKILNGTNSIKETVMDCLVTNLELESQNYAWKLYFSYLGLDYNLQNLSTCIINGSLIDSYFNNTPSALDPNYNLITNTCSSLDIFASLLLNNTSGIWYTALNTQITSLNTTPPTSSLTNYQATLYNSIKQLFNNFNYSRYAFDDDGKKYYTTTTPSGDFKLSLYNKILNISQMTLIDSDGGKMNQPVWSSCMLTVFGSFIFVCNNGFSALNPITDIKQMVSNMALGNGDNTIGYVFSNNDVIQLIRQSYYDYGPYNPSGPIYYGPPIPLMYYLTIYGSANFVVIFLGNGSFVCFNDKCSFYAHPNMPIYKIMCASNILGAETITPTNISSIDSLKTTSSTIHSTNDPQISTLQQTDQTTFSTYQTSFFKDPTTPFPTFNSQKIADLQIQLEDADNAFMSAANAYGGISGPRYNAHGLLHSNPLLTNGNLTMYQYDSPVPISSDGSYTIKTHKDSDTKISTYILLNNSIVYHQVFDISTNQFVSVATS